MKALVTGGCDDFGAELCAALGSGARGISRRSGHHIGRAVDRRVIAELSLEFDAFVNFAHQDFMQTKLLFEVAARWEAEKKSGYIFNIGSFATYEVPNRFQPWVVSKFSLDLANRHFCRRIDGGELPFRMTLLRLGLLDSRKSRAKPQWAGQGHRPGEIAHVIQNLYGWKGVANIHEVTMHSVSPLVFDNAPRNGN